MSEIGIIGTTIVWSAVVAALSILIGWPLGALFLKVKKSHQHLLAAMGMVVLATPSYAIFYAWWQMWPAGTAIHNWIVEHDIQQECISMSLLLALVGWSWPIATLVSVISIRQRSEASLSMLDSPPLHVRFAHCMRSHVKGLVATFVVIFVVTASNTTSFDLAQIRTLGNEMRIILSTGQSIASYPLLIMTSILFASVASVVAIQPAHTESNVARERFKSPAPFFVVWIVLSVLPVTLSVFASLSVNDLSLLRVYHQDVLKSVWLGVGVAITMSVFTCASFLLHASTATSAQHLSTLLKFSLLTIAFLPNTLVVEFLRWLFLHIDVVYQTSALLIIGQSLKISFVALFLGQWIASSKQLKTLSHLDATHTMLRKFSLYAPRVRIGVLFALLFSIAYSFSNLSITAQLAPPANHQPIAVALLNAMHYQRPELVTSIFAIIQLVAVVIGIFVFIAVKRSGLIVVLFVCVLGCESDSPQPLSSAEIIGGIGLSDGRFVTPRAIDANDEIIVVIDKSRRCQILNHAGECIISWELPIGTRGFPTGVSLDDDGNIWVPNTHDQNVLVLSQDGTLLHSFGTYGLGDGEFLYPTDIAFGKDKVFVSEYGGNDRISVFSMEGEFLYSFGSHGPGEGQFKRPQSIAIHPMRDELYVANAGKHTIDVFTLDGEWLRTIGKAGRERGELLYPYGIDFINDEQFVVCEYGNNRLQLFSVKGESKGVFGYAGNEIGFFKTPWAVVKIEKGLLVADTGNNRLQSLPDIMDN